MSGVAGGSSASKFTLLGKPAVAPARQINVVAILARENESLWPGGRAAPSLRLLLLQRVGEIERENVGNDAHFGRKFERITTAAGINQLDKERGEAFRRLFDARRVGAIARRLQAARGPCFADRIDSEVTRVGVCGLPQVNFLRTLGGRDDKRARPSLFSR